MPAGGPCRVFLYIMPAGGSPAEISYALWLPAARLPGALMHYGCWGLLAEAPMYCAYQRRGCRELLCIMPASIFQTKNPIRTL
jgi:hypothetical protein